LLEQLSNCWLMKKNWAPWNKLNDAHRCASESWVGPLQMRFWARFQALRENVRLQVIAHLMQFFEQMIFLSKISDCFNIYTSAPRVEGGKLMQKYCMFIYDRPLLFYPGNGIICYLVDICWLLNTEQNWNPLHR
jgi:hypothetical protein